MIGFCGLNAAASTAVRLTDFHVGVEKRVKNLQPLNHCFSLEEFFMQVFAIAILFL